MSHIHCTECATSAECHSESDARSDGWTAVEAVGTVGPAATVEYSGVCPACGD